MTATRTAILAILFLMILLGAVFAVSLWAAEETREPSIIDPTPAHACIPTRPLLGPKPGEPVEYRAPRKESWA